MPYPYTHPYYPRQPYVEPYYNRYLGGQMGQYPMQNQQAMQYILAQLFAGQPGGEQVAEAETAKTALALLALTYQTCKSC